MEFNEIDGNYNCLKIFNHKKHQNISIQKTLADKTIINIHKHFKDGYHLKHTLENDELLTFIINHPEFLYEKHSFFIVFNLGCSNISTVIETYLNKILYTHNLAGSIIVKKDEPYFEFNEKLLDKFNREKNKFKSQKLGIIKTRDYKFIILLLPLYFSIIYNQA